MFPKQKIGIVMNVKIIVLTLCEWICVLIASYFVLQTECSYDEIAASITYLVIAGLLEFIKNKVIED